MAVKTITIDIDAYNILSRHKEPGQSFTQVIKAHFGGRRTGKELQAALRNIKLSKESLEAIDLQVKARRTNKARAVKL